MGCRSLRQKRVGLKADGWLRPGCLNLWVCKVVEFRGFDLSRTRRFSVLGSQVSTLKMWGSTMFEGLGAWGVEVYVESGLHRLLTVGSVEVTRNPEDRSYLLIATRT